MGINISRLLCHIIGHFYPAYKTYKAIELNSEPLYTQWLTYWLVNTCFSLVELFSDTLFPLFFPFYFQVKTLSLLWLVSPQFMGATKLYNLVILPHLSKYESHIDDSVSRLQKQGAETFSEIGKQGVAKLQLSSIDLVKNGLNILSNLQNSAEVQRRESVEHNFADMTDSQRNDARLQGFMRQMSSLEPSSSAYARIAREARQSVDN